MAEGIRLKRAPRFIYSFRKFSVFIDGKKVGTIGNGKEEFYDVPSGQHSVKIRVGWCNSHEQMVDLQPGQEAQLECGSALGASYYAFIAVVFVLVVVGKSEHQTPALLVAVAMSLFWLYQSFRPGTYVFLRDKNSLVKA